MTRTTVSRRNLLATGACALVGTVSLPGPASASALGGQNLTNEEIIRKWYAAWEKKDLGTFNILLADNFTFTSAAGDDHRRVSTTLRQVLTKFSEFFKCWVFLKEISHLERLGTMIANVVDPQHPPFFLLKRILLFQSGSRLFHLPPPTAAVPEWQPAC